ncbi:conserved hypothetical protein [Arcobacter nitrofigilis DSM 7299]|uniref:Uncharacterized protein n=1 Tax=Arcobacter nitrofigilis (strain ATCC 33309 / DSM 7299 / CCUG 15893 / LMG 7604 / NCTC 12251 / CI) TaxID=572480 RepID=D5V3Y2_ARCNC|nr:hypothetical protein [Arcobacter nitrofigilis]ADG92810.1 conserved hypothetical protein [Arcobacter nitrofigilis DSM 7299]
MEYETPSKAWIILVMIALVNIFFILSQVKLVNTLKVSNHTKKISKGWLWSQLIPLWSYLAFMVVLFKIESQFQTYLKETSNEQNDNIKHYSTTWGLVYIAGVGISNYFPLFYIMIPIGFIGFWIHIYKVKKSLILAQYSQNLKRNS